MQLCRRLVRQLFHSKQHYNKSLFKKYSSDYELYEYVEVEPDIVQYLKDYVRYLKYTFKNKPINYPKNELTYFQEACMTLSKIEEIIVLSFVEKEKNNIYLLRLLDKHLSLKTITFHRNRSSKGLALLMIIIYEENNPQWKDYLPRVLEMISRSEDLTFFDSRMLEVLLKIYHEIGKFISLKDRKTSMLYMYATIFKLNFEKIDFYNYEMLILLLVNTTALKRKNECLIFYPLVQLLTNKLLQPIEINTNQSIDNNNIDNIKINISRFSNYFCISLCFNLVKVFSVLHGYQLYTLYNYQTKRLLMEYNLKSIFVKAVDLLRMTAGDKKRPNGNYYADEALMTIEKIKHKYYNSEIWSSGHGFYIKCFLEEFLAWKLQKYFLELPFYQEDECNYVIKKDLPIKPELPPYYWNLFAKAQIINTAFGHDLLTTLTYLYPEKNIKIPDNILAQVRYYKDNYTSIRAMDALNILGLKFYKYKLVQGKLADFVIDDDIILELDGSLHFSIGYLKFTQHTMCRNSRLLLYPKRLIIITIFYYNDHRESTKLAVLIQKKLDLLKAKDAIFVY